MVQRRTMGNVPEATISTLLISLCVLFTLDIYQGDDDMVTGLPVLLTGKFVFLVPLIYVLCRYPFTDLVACIVRAI